MGQQYVYINSPLGKIAFKVTARGWEPLGHDGEPWPLLDLLVAMSPPVQQRASEIRAEMAKARDRKSSPGADAKAEAKERLEQLSEELDELYESWDAAYNAIVAAHHTAAMETASPVLMTQLGDLLKGLVDTAYVARTLGVESATAGNYSSRGVLPPPIKVAGRSPMWAQTQIEEFIARRAESGTNEKSAMAGVRDLSPLVLAPA